MNLLYLAPYLLLVAAEVAIRAVKWQVLLSPTKRCSFWTLNSATLIGLMANNVLPFRVGEFVRAYAGARLAGIPYSTSLATVVVDRVLDGLTVSAIFIFALLFQPLPEQVKALGYLAAAMYTVMLVVLVGLLTQEQRTLRLITWALGPVPATLRARLLEALITFVHGLSVFRNFRLFALAIITSFAIWIGYAAGVYLMILAFDINLSFFDAFIVLIIVTLGVTLPSTPGFVGVMEGGIVFGLNGLFGIDKTQAFAMAVVYHVSQYIPITVGGIIALWLERMSMTEIAHVPTSGQDIDGPAAASST